MVILYGFNVKFGTFPIIKFSLLPLHNIHFPKKLSLSQYTVAVPGNLILSKMDI